jgi:hypothetical protein
MNYRHGDVIILEIPAIPTEAKKEKGLTLAYGEATGHHHTIVEGEGSIFRYDEKMYLRITSKIAKIDHPEHGLKTLEKGDYEIDIQQEWKEDGWTKVID